MRSPSACNSMSSQTHPQKVHVAFRTTVRGIASQFVFLSSQFSVLSFGLPTRPGRNDKRSTKLAAGEAASSTARHEAALLDLFPRSLLILRRAQDERWNNRR